MRGVEMGSAIFVFDFSRDCICEEERRGQDSTEVGWGFVVSLW